MSEQIPSFLRPEIPVVGAAPDEKKRDIQAELQENFGNNRKQLPREAVKKLRMLEYQKHDFEQAAIQKINELLNAVLKELKLPPFDISEKNIYSVPKSMYEEIDGKNVNDSYGFTRHQEQVIALNSEELTIPYKRISTLLHEMIHLKGFLSVEASDDDQTLRRIGLEAHSSLKTNKENEDSFRHLIGLNEAVVSELQKRLFGQVVEQNPFLDEERKDLLSTQNKELIKKAKEKTKLPENEFVYVGPRGEDGWEAFTFPYREQRKVLEYLLETIQKTDPERFPSQDDVFHIFLQAHFGGQLIPLARVIDDTFGKGTFRVLATMSGKDEESAYRVLAYLKKNTHLDLRT